MDAIILDIQRMSTEDGPGLRTTVFFKGCNLACPWCHNPESIGKRPDPTWLSHKCMGCNICLKVCAKNGISRNEDGIFFNRPICKLCLEKEISSVKLLPSKDQSYGICAKECPAAAIEIKGEAMNIEKLTAELVKDRAYFGEDGGITLSGGEVFVQYEAALELARLLKARGLHIAVDTAGSYDFRFLEAMLPHIDMVLYDLKIFDEETHKRIIGTGNRLILKNYKQLMERKVRVWVRTPVIYGATDSKENIAAIGSFIAECAEHEKWQPEKWELCAFNNLCRGKYERLDKEWIYKDVTPTEKSHIEKLTALAVRHFPGAVYTGAVKE